jgi:Xaa-Pro aminopeptidase
MRGRGDRLEALLAEAQLDRTLVTDLANVRYLTGFTGTNGACVCAPGTRLFLTDFRYTERAAGEVEGWDVVTVAGERWIAGLAERLKGRCGFDDAHLSVRLHNKLREEAGEDVDLVPDGGLVQRLRRVKDPDELRLIGAAAELADEVYRWSLARGFRGRSELEVARDAERRIRELGGEPAFPPIVGAGPNGALPHHEPSEREIGEGELVVFDMGAQLDGYNSDCTRTFATGRLAESAQATYELVREAQAAGLTALAPEVRASEVDQAARERIEAAGEGERFRHGLGHGVGLEVHEAPRLAPSSEDVLAAGEVVTIEPGVYLPGELGVRIEDLVVVAEGGHRNLSGLPKELQLVD